MVKTIVDIKQIKKAFKRDYNQEKLVLDNINFTVKQGEIIALLGTSGSGKSTLLRIIAGLVKPSSGSVTIQDKQVHGPVPGVGMVFQNFALFPWMTVLQNVEIGLEALGIGAEERRHRAIEAIDMVGMDGFESAFPRELSGGMCQRVGIARALVVEPKVLLLDEPFSALDILTADNLRNDLLALWAKKRTAMQAMLIVTHNIEEAVMLADRILIFAHNPGRIQEQLEVSLAHPRQDKVVAMQALMEEVYQKVAQINHAERARGQRFKTITLYYRIPKVEMGNMIGLVEALASEEFKSDSELSTLAEELYLDLDDLMPIIECLDILRLAVLEGGQVALTEVGEQFAKADLFERKNLFAQQLQTHVPLARHIDRVLRGRPNYSASGQRFLIELQDDLSEDAAQEVLKVVIEWGRYAELFAYDHNTDTLSFDDPK
ncbi:MAG: nitrate/sulfonate/bicarbonate ABC transporter ATP-binding protein [Pseudomonadota bacterium]|nr:nitrate/sulfonate/bicarbonate ABC transporter ATP-binding protein [Pseudomonadota bacterium]